MCIIAKTRFVVAIEKFPFSNSGIHAGAFGTRWSAIAFHAHMDKPLGLVINFGNEHLPKRGVKRVILKDADDETAPF